MGSDDKAADDRGGGTLLSERVRRSSLYPLCKAEECLIYRRRNNLTQAQMSEIYLVPRRRYGEMEADGQIELEQDVLPLTANEECYLLRKRSGLTQEQVAEQIGVTRYWLNQIELGKAASDKLEAFWNEG